MRINTDTLGGPRKKRVAKEKRNQKEQEKKLGEAGVSVLHSLVLVLRITVPACQAQICSLAKNNRPANASQDGDGCSGDSSHPASPFSRGILRGRRQASDEVPPTELFGALCNGWHLSEPRR